MNTPEYAPKASTGRKSCGVPSTRSCEGCEDEGQRHTAGRTLSKLGEAA